MKKVGWLAVLVVVVVLGFLTASDHGTSSPPASESDHGTSSPPVIPVFDPRCDARRMAFKYDPAVGCPPGYRKGVAVGMGYMPDWDHACVCKTYDPQRPPIEYLPAKPLAQAGPVNPA